MSKVRKQIKKITLDGQLEQDGKNKDHYRKQKNLDALSNVSTIAIYAVPSLVFLWIILMTIHYIYTNKWDAIQSGGQSLLIYVAGYITRYMQTMGIKKD